ncbi:long-chain fatty acid--CoA ligase [Vibrio genomosp. F10 str. ZF-129]|uniref:Long-chain fatty acid--CoA ligase n=1 Tax=Vibrio genomosp. F10 str. ZF-129 TaxID=1187848 RepID=A0A1E5BGS5_9VIBR|nr:AMP-binding protein [Vibrio genomosp. F10]OEE35837.1 long-chain fatty acid--CoA ligase [Vibrio genomosp. F10 str. ZF-129]
MNTLLKTINKWAKTTPENLAFVGEDNSGQSVRISYIELQEKILKTAKALTAQNIKVLALRSQNSPNWAIIDLAAMHANIVVVPIPTFFSIAQVEHTLHQSGVDALIGDWQAFSDLSQKKFSAVQVNNIVIAGLPLMFRTAPEQVSYLTGTGKITFTSGSTGQPKGVCLSNEHLYQVANSLAQSVRHIARTHLVLLPLSTLLENITGIYVPLLLGGTSYILPGEQTGLTGSSQFDTTMFAKALARVKPDSLVLTPALLLALIQIIQQQPELSASLTFVAVGGARVSSQLINAAHSLHIPAFEGYGLSECGSVVCLNTPSHFKPGTSGKPLPHVQVRIAEDGELLVSGNTALGYLNEAFAQEWLATGDLAQIDDHGYITLSGRKKNLIVTAYGRNISPEWVESEALSFLPSTPLIVTGDTQQALCAVAASYNGISDDLNDGNCDSIKAQIAALNSTLPDYAQIRMLLIIENPQAITHWYTENGKLKRDQIEQSVSQFLSCKTSELTLDGQKVQIIDLPFQQSIAS